MSLDDFNGLKAAIIEIQAELGTDPQGVYSTTRARLDILETRINNPFVPSPNVENPFVIGNTGVTISSGLGLPNVNEINGSLYLRSDGNNVQGLYARRNGQWLQVDTDHWLANGDLTGTYSSQTVTGLQNKPILSQAPTNGQVLTWSSPDNAWKPISSKNNS